VLVLSLSAVMALAALWLLQTSPAAQLEREIAARRATAQVDVAARGPAPTLAVDAYTVRTRKRARVVELAGMLEPARSAVIGSELAGRVIAIDAEEHTSVVEGQVLVRLDPALARVAVERARASLLRAQAADRLARADLARRRDLAGRGVISPAELDRAESTEQSDRAGVAEARAALLDAETRLAKTRIKAPFDGFLSQLDLEPGVYLQAGARVAELSDLSQIEIEVGVSDQEILALRDGDPAEVEIQVLPGERFAGRIARLGRTPDAETRKYSVPVRVPNAEGRLLPGMRGTVRFELEEARSVLHVPRRAVVREFDLEYVYLLVPEDRDGDVSIVQRRRTRTRPVPFRPDLVELREGVEAGHRIAVSGVRELRDGLRVRVRREESGAES
jgi:membrane fusion protein (multidrug efflux system)